MRILDLSAGYRAMWFDKEYRDTTFVDVRPEVEPSVVADSRQLPSQIGDGYDLIVFDPPHDNFGANSQMTKRYGHSTWEQIRDTVKGTAAEAWRVSRTDALMVFKWNTHTHKLGAILGLVTDYWEPLFANITSSRRRHLVPGSDAMSETYWVMLRRRAEKYVDPIFDLSATQDKS